MRLPASLQALAPPWLMWWQVPKQSRRMETHCLAGHVFSRHPLRSAKFKLSAVESLSASKEGGWRMRFREEPVTPVYRHWMCEQVGCNGELLSTGEGITRLSTRWKHRWTLIPEEFSERGLLRTCPEIEKNARLKCRAYSCRADLAP